MQYQFTLADRIRGFIWRIGEPFRTDKTPAWASVLALLLAVGPGVSQRIERGTWGEYEPTIAVLTATLIALIWTAHYTFRAVRHARQVEEREDTRRRLARMSMTTGVMAELEYLQPSLALMHARIAVRGIHFLERPQLRHALAHIDLFSTAAAADLSQFDSILRQIESHAALYGADHAAADEAALTHGIGIAGRPLLKYDPKWVEDIRTMIESAQAIVPLLNKRLMQEG